MVGADGSAGETGPPGAGNCEALSFMWGKESAPAPPAAPLAFSDVVLLMPVREEPGSAPSDVWATPSWSPGVLGNELCAGSASGTACSRSHKFICCPIYLTGFRKVPSTCDAR